ncbi:ester cyclase [Nostoc punctiforme UO1]|uniref:ester cyclase n=1 Tax=Nostoc punctiforme TaxID=272131 RepID=UPI0030978C92
MSLQQENINLYMRFLTAMNNLNYSELDKIFVQSFVDHHPGFELNSLADYKESLKAAYQAINIQAILDEIIAVDDKLITRATLTGKHVDKFFGALPTGNSLRWTTIEIWRVENHKFVERWAEDDLLGLVRQLGITLPF